jgi:lysophospholipase L1-like esterase
VHNVLAFASAVFLLLAGLIAAAPAHADSAPARPLALWIGDSYTAGTGAGDMADSYPAIVSRAMGWSYRVDAQGGTGFTARGPAKWGGKRLPDRLSTAAERWSPDFVIVDAGRNDHNLEVAEKTIREYFPTLRETWPNATVVVIVPWFVRSTAPNPLAPYVIDEAKQIDALIEDPFAAGWGGADQTGDLTTDGVHPDAEGHRHIATHLLADFWVVGLDSD